VILILFKKKGVKREVGKEETVSKEEGG